ncbi:MAG: SGNH/GDSL hydrolase family protein [Oculatellaceae cyanobacterium Prado106]|jgi:phospholipase/lecithinase/hemolysin|nr:SGNH/GDSL hydrolase family protein [Oculatellaceae cyanobacterium Prado106]
MINSVQVINAYRGLSLDQSSQDTDIDALLDYLKPAERSCHYRPFTQLFVFGDSLSDQGNTFRLTQEALGQGIPPAPPYFPGHFCNGPIWVDYLTRFLKLSSYDHTTFAVAGATTGTANTFPDIPVNPLPGLQQQIESFITSLEGTSADPEALYIIWAGANDYLSGLVSHPAAPIENLMKATQALIHAGAQNLMVANLPSLGKLPNPSRDRAIAEALNALTDAHNAGLAAALQTLRQSVGSQANLMLFDVGALLKQVLAHPEKFGFTNVTDAEMAKLASLRGYTEKFFFWDGVHPTTIAHLTLAKEAASLLMAKTEALVG